MACASCIAWRVPCKKFWTLNTGKSRDMMQTPAISQPSTRPAAWHLRNALKRSQASGHLKEILAALDDGEYWQLAHDWFGVWARPDQLPPEEANWRNWLVLGGRGSGKTRTGAEWVRAAALGCMQPHVPKARRIALVAPTYAEARL